MRKGKKVKKMTNNIQGFFPARIDVKVNKYLGFPNIFPHLRGRAIQIIWTNILGIDDKTLIAVSLVNSPKFRIFVQETREDFKSNNTNLRRYPKMNESDWK